MLYINLQGTIIKLLFTPTQIAMLQINLRKHDNYKSFHRLALGL